MKKKILMLVLLAAGMVFTAVPARAANPVLAFHGGFRGGHARVIISGGWGWGWGWGYPGYAYGAYPAYSGPPVWARVKTDVSPEEALVYLDGQLIGTADDFDGWPDYLYLRRGRYRIEFRLDGYETRTVEVDARPGQTLRIDDKLKKIPGARQHGSYDQPKIQGGIQRFWAKRRGSVEPMDPYAQGDDDRRRGYDGDNGREGDRGYGPEDDRDRGAAREPSPRGDRDWRGDRRPADVTAEAPRADAASTKSRLRLNVEPSDAAVYVDDRFVGTAEEVNSLDKGLAVPAGKHTVTVSRPGFVERTVHLEVKPGESQKVEVSLSR